MKESEINPPPSTAITLVPGAKIIRVSVTRGSKWNCPQKQYSNHALHVTLEAEVELDADVGQVINDLQEVAAAKVSEERTRQNKRAQLEKDMEERRREFGYKLSNIRNYDEGHKSATRAKQEANEIYADMQGIGLELAKLGVQVELPKPVLDVTPAQPLPSSAGDESDDLMEDDD